MGEMEETFEGEGQEAGSEGKVQDYKFLGQVVSFDTKKQFGMVQCPEATEIWGADVYIHKMVMDSCSVGEGEWLRFGVHVNTRGQPQASLPVWKVGEDGAPIDVKPDEVIIPVEESAAADPAFLAGLGEAIAKRSEQQNHNRKRKVDEAWGGGGKSKSVKGGGKGGDAWGGGKGGKGGGWGADPWSAGGWGGDAWGGGGVPIGASKSMSKGGGKLGAGAGGVDLFVGGVPHDATKRELHHIFRQYAGFTSLRMVQKDKMLVFVSFATWEQAQFVADALTGYVFDEESMDQTVLTVSVSKPKGGKDTGKGKW